MPSSKSLIRSKLLSSECTKSFRPTRTPLTAEKQLGWQVFPAHVSVFEDFRTCTFAHFLKGSHCALYPSPVCFLDIHKSTPSVHQSSAKNTCVTCIAAGFLLGFFFLTFMERRAVESTSSHSQRTTKRLVQKGQKSQCTAYVITTVAAGQYEPLLLQL